MTEIEKRTQELLGNAYLKKGELDEAIKAFKLAKAKDKLILCGEKCLEEGELDDSIKAFKLAKTPIPKDKLILCGEKCLEKGWIDYAKEVFKAVARIELQEQ